jgi:hypothetical protein
VMCRTMVVSMPLTKEPHILTKEITVWIGDTLELKFNSRREEKRPTRLPCCSSQPVARREGRQRFSGEVRTVSMGYFLFGPQSEALF